MGSGTYNARILQACSFNSAPLPSYVKACLEVYTAYSEGC